MYRLLSVILAVLVLWLVAAQAQEATTAEPTVSETVVEALTGPDDITVGVYINDIQQLDLQTHSYAMDFYIWMRWTNPDINPSATLEFMNPFQLWGHIPTPLYEEPQVLEDGSNYMAIRYQGQFNSKLPLEKYPFDSQSLIVEFEDNSAGAARQNYVADVEAVTLNPEMTLPGYILGTPTMSIKAKPYPTNFGDTNLAEHEPYSRVTIAVPVHRPPLTYAIKVILPIFLVAACAALVFFIHPTYVEGRIGMGITALLTLVALQLTSNSQLPEVDYLMMIDMLFIAAYIFVIAALAQVVRTSWAAHRGDEVHAIQQDRTAIKVLGLSYVVINALIMIVTLSQ
jgi:hypothetical protein